ncbi:MAG: hypothetical protein K0Q95_1172 [Bacteroidota bacterium]|jgi:hypothetical protein|nr:hypothetical protein [Bacteroidota bacterium]
MGIARFFYHLGTKDIKIFTEIDGTNLYRIESGSFVYGHTEGFLPQKRKGTKIFNVFHFITLNCSLLKVISQRLHQTKSARIND